jgi:hypothetical protein
VTEGQTMSFNINIDRLNTKPTEREKYLEREDVKAQVNKYVIRYLLDSDLVLQDGEDQRKVSYVLRGLITSVKNQMWNREAQKRAERKKARERRKNRKAQNVNASVN